MFVYCTEVLHLSEAEAYLRIAVARAARSRPVLLEMLGDGRLHLSGIAKLASHLTESNRDEFLSRAAHKSKRQIEELIAELRPKPDVPTSIRKLPENPRRTPPTPPPTPPTELRPDRVAPPAPAPRQPGKPIEPLSPARYKIQFTADAELRAKLERLQALTDKKDLADVIDQAVTEKLARLEARRYGRTESPRQTVDQARTLPNSRTVPAPVKRAVWKRDEGRCTFVDEHGRRCKERTRLEFHHRQPFGKGGDHSVDNLALLCRAHNGYVAELDYGKEKMAKYLGSANRVSESGPVYGLPAIIPRPPPELFGYVDRASYVGRVRALQGVESAPFSGDERTLVKRELPAALKAHQDRATKRSPDIGAWSRASGNLIGR
jgi:5-methylcytosine-specific restriction endonuclease McrA